MRAGKYGLPALILDLCDQSDVPGPAGHGGAFWTVLGEIENLKTQWPPISASGFTFP